MRNPERLNDFYDEIKRIHKEYFPDWRFGQFMSNWLGWIYQEKKKNKFFPEENKMLEYLKEYVGEDNVYKERKE